jgi:hypothetical protein
VDHHLSTVDFLRDVVPFAVNDYRTVRDVGIGFDSVQAVDRIWMKEVFDYDFKKDVPYILP